MKDALGDRMKEFYENVYRIHLTRRTPVILRLDGKSFHTYCKSLKDRFNKGFMRCMDLTAIRLMGEIQGAQLAFVQSDEISILLHDYKKLTSEAWMKNNIQKMVSISAAIASVEFTKNSPIIWGFKELDDGSSIPITKEAYFDSRVFTIPEAEVCNYFIWRQNDATRNSILSLGQSLFSHKQLQGLNCSIIQDICHDKGHNWNDLPTSHKRGRCIVKKYHNFVSEGGVETIRSKWVVDEEIPIFTQDRNYINKYLAVDNS
ncbi:hypothetical protein H6G33_10005 [Calothrix sp. FACHB-1219]|uniref:tRNA(His) guanylyltransferase Thg1 family protein n=1 Tax=unclassified Calothrix TaxID=2619626 RepID=UPI001689409D|nr:MULTISPECIES: tRNA(His) guanylyltransferase Thg1 family protein [unclassified Calothrix]MBD2201680.1 hypothetical protein [Calothrix sp. FACHB-168]MBD2217366.1 hypothetical protein [Calothrix sp. FACHB-1219]